MRVLIADDNADNRQLLEDILLDKGHTTLTARDGIEALALASQELPDLLILDINMPGMNGFDVCTNLKAEQATSEIPVLMLTALADIEDRVTGLGLGADDYLTKPFSPLELIARIDARLRIKSNTDELRTTQGLIRTTFERFVPAHVVQDLLQHPEQVKLGGQLQTVTVCFADLEGFTSISENTNPERLLIGLNQYHALMFKYFQAHGGTVNKFLGDGLMALFNTPLCQPDHTLRAVRAALNIQQALPAFYEELAPAFHLKINFGIHTGEALVGLVGAEELMDYTAIGDTVNLASRLQDLSHTGQILVSEMAHQTVQDHVIAECLGSHIVKNRTTPVTVYEIKGLRT